MPRPLQQHPHFAACLRAGGRDVVETDAGIMMLRRFAGVQVGLVSRGSRAMIDTPAPTCAIRIFNADHEMDEGLRRAGFMRIRPPATCAQWDVSGDQLARRAGLRKTWRHALDRSDQIGLRLAVTQMPASGSHWLLQAEQAQARARRYRALPLWLTLAWATLYPNDAILIEAQLSGKPVAGMVFLRHGTAATYHIAHCSDEGKAHEAHRAMLWHAASYLAKRGVTQIDLGLIDRHANEGLARFKAGTGATQTALGGTWVQVPGLATFRDQLVRQFPFGKKA